MSLLLNRTQSEWQLSAQRIHLASIYLMRAPLAGVFPVPSFVSQNWMPLPAVVSCSHSGTVIASAAGGWAAKTPAHHQSYHSNNTKHSMGS